MPPPTVASTRALWGLACVGGSFVLAVGLLINGFYQRFAEAGPAAHAVLTAVGIVLTGVAVLMFGVEWWPSSRLCRLPPAASAVRC